MTDQRPLGDASSSDDSLDRELRPLSVSDASDTTMDPDSSSHFALLYETQDELFDTAIAFIQAGLERGDHCWYVVDDTSKEAVMAAMRARGIDVDAACAAGDLSILSPSESYGETNEFDAAAMVETWEARIDEAINKEGYEGFRIAGEATWELGGDGLIDGVRDYESQLNECFAHEDCRAMCMYNRQRFPAAVLDDVIQHHPQVVYDDTMTQNLYYVPPDEKHPQQAVERKLQTLVDQTTARQQREQRLSEQTELEEYGAFVRAVEDYAIFMLDPDGDVISWNAGAERIKGYTKDDIVGEHFSAFYTAADIDEGVPEANLETAAAEGRVEDEGWRVRKDGSQFWADVVITAIRDDDGTLQGFTKVTRDRTEQREYERQLRQERDLTEQILETVPVGICSITSDGDFVRANQRALTCIGCEASDLADYSVDSWDLYDAEGAQIPTDERPWTRVTETGEPVYDYQCQVDLPDLGRRWFSLNAAPLYDDPSNDQSDEASKTVVALEDITDRKQTTDALAYLNDTTRELMEAEPQAITERAADITQEVLDIASTSLWRYDETAGDLQLHTASTASGIDPEAIRYPDDFEEQAWQTFISRGVDTSNDFPPTPERGASETPIRSGVILPLGRHGVLCAGSIHPDAFDETTVDLAETVAATIETALDRAAAEQELAHQNEELTHLNRINGIIRDIDQALVQAETREEIDRVVCERLAQSEAYHCAWIGEYDLDTETISPRDWDGIDASYIEDLTITTDDTKLGQGPIGTAARTHEIQVVRDIITNARFAPWREQTLAYGMRSCLAIPLVYNDSLYGVLAVYTSSPQSDTKDHAVLEELGETIAYTLNTVETKETIHTDSIVELELEFRDPDTPLCHLAQQADCRIDFEGLIPQANGSSQVFFTAPAALQTAEELPIAIGALTCLADRGDASQFKAAVADPSLPSLLVKQDAVISSLTIEGESATAVVELPSTVAVRTFIDAIQTQYPTADLRRRRTQDRSIDTAYPFPSTVDERLTDRQQEILLTAYKSGFFQSPRESTGKEIAAMLDISPPTFTQHLRAGQHNLCEELFDDG